MNPTKQSLRATLTSIGTNSDRKAVTRRDKRSEKPNSKLSKSLQDATSLLLPKSIRRQSQDFGSSVLRKDESNYSYESLKIAYQSVLNENTCLRDGKINQISKSTVKFENENYEAFSFEIEDLCEVLSNSHKSIQQLLQNIRVSSQDYASLKRKLNLLY